MGIDFDVVDTIEAKWLNWYWHLGAQTAVICDRSENLNPINYDPANCDRKRRSISYRSVSYTHLDVYKRQVLDFVPLHFRHEHPSISELLRFP